MRQTTNSSRIQSPANTKPHLSGSSNFGVFQLSITHKIPKNFHPQQKKKNSIQSIVMLSSCCARSFHSLNINLQCCERFWALSNELYTCFLLLLLRSTYFFHPPRDDTRTLCDVEACGRVVKVVLGKNRSKIILNFSSRSRLSSFLCVFLISLPFSVETKKKRQFN